MVVCLQFESNRFQPAVHGRASTTGTEFKIAHPCTQIPIQANLKPAGLKCGHGRNHGNPRCIHLPARKGVWGPERGVGTGSSAAEADSDEHLWF